MPYYETSQNSKFPAAEGHLYILAMDIAKVWFTCKYFHDQRHNTLWQSSTTVNAFNVVLFYKTQNIPDYTKVVSQPDEA